MLDKETVREIEETIDAVVIGGEVQMRINGFAVNTMMSRIMFTDVETVERSVAWCIYKHSMDLRNIDNFMRVVIPNSPFKGFTNVTYALFDALCESREIVLDNLEDLDFLKGMAEGDYIFSLVLMDIFSEMKSPHLEDLKNYLSGYGLTEKKYQELEQDLQVINGK